MLPRLTDSHGRVIHDLRVSITDRCNYKCVYCRTGEVGAQYPELAIDEYLRLIRLFVSLGITKVRLTGGEPLLRRGLVDLVKALAKLRTIHGEPLDLALTTNGHLLESLAVPAPRRRPSSRYRQHGRRRRADLRAHHPHPGQLRNGSARCARRARGRPRRRSRSTAFFCADSTTIRSKASPTLRAAEDVVVRFIEFMPLEEGRLWTPEIVVPLQRDRRSHQPRPAAD